VLGLKRRMSDDERGAILVTFAVFLPLAMAIAALVFDAGFAWGLKRHLQASADAAALAAAQDLPDPTAATAMAHSYSASSGGKNHRSALPSVTTQVQLLDSNTRVRVTQTAASPTWFARLMGLNKVDVSAFAVAQMVQQPAADNWLVYGRRTDCGDVVKINGNDINIEGGVRSNGAIDINGKDIEITNASGHGEPPKACAPKVSGSGTDVDVEEDATVHPWPLYYSFPGDGDGAFGDPKTPFPANYCTFKAKKFEFSGNDSIADGVYCAEEEFKISGNSKTARITVLAPLIQIGGNGHNLRYYDETRKLLLFSTGTKAPPATDTPPCLGSKYEMQVNGGSMTIDGILFNPCGLVHVNGNNGSFLKGYLVGQSVHLNGNDFNLEGIGGGSTGAEKTISLIE
jgi:Flp pilus assembly protein TadG